ncbi:hypothetical protein ACWDTQ_28800 [Streptomyces cellulosae]
MPNGISITDQLGPHEWSNEETAAYEAAIEAVNGAVGAYSAVITPAAGARLGPARPSSAAARSRSTTHVKPPTSGTPSTGPDRIAPRHGPEADQRRGRSK